ncbi:uncharacterized protein LOC123534711 [Mercenaria mercenaria]|uniref:uncharacterized protein LOC123534711 n=1 Tax=Mercenaria mercenaria TaxID=6596 RepID=UPI00234EA1A3|nr:uncharacterized protein LOC123534711 [Mercenaria mercenaria]XP_045173006.2 uncharacterized protein LOC123534711 [Mercenaria mercenaria]
METKTILAVFAVVFTLVALGLTIAAVAIPIWWDFSSTITIGLFRSCVKYGTLNICLDNTDVSDRLQATRWLVVAACSLLGFALLFGFLLLCLKNKCLAVSACVLDVVAGACILAAVAITAEDTLNSPVSTLDYGIAFILACVALALAIIAGVIFAFATPKKSGTKGHVISPM